MCAPLSMVPSPSAWPPVMRGRTTQKRVSSTTRSLALGVISALTRMFGPLVSSIDFTMPMSMSLYLIRVLPASRPSPELNVISIAGAEVEHALHREPPPIAERDDRHHPDERRPARLARRRAAASGTSAAGCWRSGVLESAMVAPAPRHRRDRIPQQPRVEAARSEHREHDDGGESGRRRPDRDRRRRDGTAPGATSSPPT